MIMVHKSSVLQNHIVIEKTVLCINIDALCAFSAVTMNLKLKIRIYIYIYI